MQPKCVHCGKCTPRCEVLSIPGLDIGNVAAAYDEIMAQPEEEQLTAVQALVKDNPGLYNALRQCCFCGFCTATCEEHMLAPANMRPWRELFMRAGIMPPDDSKLVMVDNEWHIFSAYRAIYGISYPEFTTLEAAAEHGPGLADTLFFPGCSLVSYTPELTRAVGQWLTDAGISWAFSDDCCGSPLMSAGLFDRAHDLRMRTIDRMRAAGITRMLTVCPGCGEELAIDMPDDIEIVPLVEVMCDVTARRAEAGEESGLASFQGASITFLDACHDRADSRHAEGVRTLMDACAPDAEKIELEHSKHDALCCGAGGAVSSYDPDITSRRVRRIVDEVHDSNAETLVTMCPTCAYTIAQENLGSPDRAVGNRHYLELAFGVTVDWATVFSQLGSMWTGEYATWLNETFF